MGYRFPLGWLLMALLANPLAAQTRECGEVALADCLAMPLPSQVFDAEDPALPPALPADPGQNDYERRKTLKRLAEAGDTQANWRCWPCRAVALALPARSWTRLVSRSGPMTRC